MACQHCLSPGMNVVSLEMSLSDVCRWKKSSKTVKAKVWGRHWTSDSSLRGGQKPVGIALSPFFFSLPSSHLLSPSLPVSLTVSQGHVQSETFWPIRQLHGHAPLLSFSFLVCLCNLSSVCIQVEHLELTPQRAGSTYLHSQNLQTSSWAVFTHPLYLP